MHYLSLHRNLHNLIPLLNPGAGSSGNFTADIQSQICNPLTILFEFLTRSIDSLNVLGLFNVLFYNCIMVCGIIYLGKRIGLSLNNTSIVALIITSSSLYLYWWEADWVIYLEFLAFVPWLWGLIYAKVSRTNLIAISLVVAEIVLQANPFALVLTPILIAVLVFEEFFLERDFKSAVLKLFSATCGLLIAAVPWLWFYGEIPFMSRNSVIINTTFGVPNLSSFLLTSFPFGGVDAHMWFTVSKAPLFYISFLTFPIIALFKLTKKTVLKKGVLASLILSLVTILLTQTPSDVGPFRWPIRYFMLGTVAIPILLACILQFGAMEIQSTRIVILVTLTVAALAVGYSKSPTGLNWYLIYAVITIFSTYYWIRSYQTGRIKKSSYIFTCVTLLLTTLLLIRFPSNPDMGDWGAPTKLVTQQTFDSPGTMILKDYSGPNVITEDKIYAGNTETLVAKFSGFAYNNQVGNNWIDNSLCSNYRGEVCPASVDFLSSKELQTGRTWLQLLFVNRIVAENGPVGSQVDRDLPSWIAKSYSSHFNIYSNPQPESEVGSVTYSSPAIKLLRLIKSSEDESSQYYEVNGSGYLVLRNIFMPGWRYSINGKVQMAGNLDNRLVKIPIATNGNSTVVHIYYRPPYWKSGFVLSGIGLIGSIGLAFLPGVEVRIRNRRKAKF